MFPRELYRPLQTELPVLMASEIAPAELRGARFIELWREMQLTPAAALPNRELLRLLNREAYQCFEAEQQQGIGAFWRDTFGTNFTCVSKAVLTGGRQDWWKIPQLREGGSFSATHLVAQNRHPCIRIALSGAEARKAGVPRRFVIGFKGGGFCNSEAAQLTDVTTNLRLPFRCNDLEDKPVEGDPDVNNPAPNPKLWGADYLDGHITEAASTVALRAHLSRHAPDFADLVPQPIGVYELQSIPAWDESGTTTWFSSAQYISRFMPEVYGNESRLAVYASAQLCDVRVRQLYTRVFVRSSEGTTNYRVAANEVASSLRSLFWWNQESTRVGIGRGIEHRSTLSIKDLLAELAAEYERNPGRADRIFGNTAGRICELVGFVHGQGGNFGSGLRRTWDNNFFGTAWGGPLAMRNIDLCGGLHDFDMPYLYFPWAAKDLYRSESDVLKRAEHPRSRAWDLVYLGEAVSWFDLILRGRRDVELGDTPVVVMRHDQFNDVTVLNETGLSGMAARMRGMMAIASHCGLPRDLEAPPNLLGEEGTKRYVQGFKRGLKIASAASEGDPALSTLTDTRPSSGD